VPAGPRASRLRTEGVTWQVVGDQIVLLDLTASHYVELNTSGSFLFRLIDEGSSDEELALALTSRYGLDAATARADVAEFLELLTHRNLLAPPA
jgi:hypothetical protein